MWALALQPGPPPPELARELEQVRSRARALSDYLRSANAPLPDDFPKADILAIAAEMADCRMGPPKDACRRLSMPTRGSPTSAASTFRWPLPHKPQTATMLRPSRARMALIAI